MTAKKPLAFVLLLYASLPFTPRVVDALKAQGWLELVVALVFAGAAVAAAYILIFRLRLRSPKFYGLLCLTLGLLAMLVGAVKTHQERIHFLEYGALALLIGHATRRAMPAFLWAAAAGILDECLQYFLPMRFFDVRDLAFNVTAAAFGAVVWRLISHFAPDFHGR